MSGRIWLTGSKGMLGNELSLLLEKNALPFVASDLETDVTDASALKSFTKNKQIDWIVNCAAYTAVDRAEDDFEACRRLNTLGAANIAACAKSSGARLVHISTDYVFNGNGNWPYTEEDASDPIGVYGLTKRDGETRVLEENEKSYIIRTSWLYGRHGNNFVQTMLRLMNECDEVKVVSDQKGSPTWAYDLSSAILSLIRTVDSGKDIPFGIYHYTNEAEITWFGFARKIYEQARSLGILNKDCEVIPCTSAEFPSKVKRPAYSVLDKTKIKAALGITIPKWDASLREFLKTCVD